MLNVVNCKVIPWLVTKNYSWRFVISPSSGVRWRCCLEGFLGRSSRTSGAILVVFRLLMTENQSLNQKVRVFKPRILQVVGWLRMTVVGSVSYCSPTKNRRMKIALWYRLQVRSVSRKLIMLLSWHDIYHLPLMSSRDIVYRTLCLLPGETVASPMTLGWTWVFNK